VLQRGHIGTRHRNVGNEAKGHEHAQGEEQLAPEIGNFERVDGGVQQRGIEHDSYSIVSAVPPADSIFSRALAEKGNTPGGRRAIFKHIGNALLIQHRVSGRVAVAEKPDVVWDRADLERLYARLEDEYELNERAEALERKLSVISKTAEVLTDMIDTKRSLRLEFIIVLLILFEIMITSYQLLTR